MQKNATTVDTFSANATQNKTINITVPTTVAELTDASDYAKKTDVSSDLADYTPTANLWAAALSNDYNDLNNKPTIPTVNNATLTIQKNSTNVATFTANSNTPTVANISVPTAVSDLSDASDYATKTYADNAASTAAGNVNWILSGPLVPPASAQWAWKIFYCTTDNTFYECNWTTWTELWGATWAITNNTTWTTSTISQEWVGTKAEFEALSSYWNIIYNITE